MFEHEDVLGDIVISTPIKLKNKRKEYGHSFEREIRSYMVVHGFYHLMGYDVYTRRR
ncbi:MAG: rRNA maturation RNase YbeY [Clostridia bacterium]